MHLARGSRRILPTSCGCVTASDNAVEAQEFLHGVGSRIC